MTEPREDVNPAEPDAQQSLSRADEEREVVAAAIRAAVPDDSECVADEDECFRRHPVHLMASSNGVIQAVYAKVEAVARLAVEALDLPARDARVRAQAIADVVALLSDGPRYMDWCRENRSVYSYGTNEVVRAALYVEDMMGRAPSVRPEDLTAGDRGTPTHPEPRTGEERCSYCRTKDRDECEESP